MTDGKWFMANEYKRDFRIQQIVGWDHNSLMFPDLRDINLPFITHSGDNYYSRYGKAPAHGDFVERNMGMQTQPAVLSASQNCLQTTQSDGVDSFS